VGVTPDHQENSILPLWEVESILARRHDTAEGQQLKMLMIQQEEG
jgi:hypothetical protein